LLFIIMYWSGVIFEFDNFVFHIFVFVIFIFISKYKITVSKLYLYEEA